MANIADETIFPQALHFELTSDLDNVGQFLGQRVNAEDATYVAVKKADWHKLQLLATEGRVAIQAERERKKIMEVLLRDNPDLTPAYYAASLKVNAGKKGGSG